MHDGKLQWHPAFSAVLRIELLDELDKIKIEDEHLLGKKPLQTDFLVVKLDGKQKIHKNIGQLFQKYNIVEYKSPDDSLSINDFYKVYAYACLYQSDTEKVMEIPPDEIGITFVCNHYPVKMLKHIQNTRGMTIKKCEQGIYELKGDPFPMQLIITHELTKEKNFWMQSLRNDLKSGGEIRNLIETYDKNKTQPLYQAVMDVILRANYKEVEVEKNMCQALMELFAEDFEVAEKKGLEKGKRKGIKALVEVLHDLQLTQKEVTEKVMSKFELSRTEAENFVNTYWK